MIVDSWAKGSSRGIEIVADDVTTDENAYAEALVVDTRRLATNRFRFTAVDNILSARIQGSLDGTNFTENAVEAFDVVANLATVTIATDTPGVANVNEVQVLTYDGTPTGGSFALTYDGNESALIAFDANAATIQAALELNASIGAGNVECDGDLTTGLSVHFIGALAGTDVGAITLTKNYLVDSTSPTVEIEETTPGVASVNEIQTLTMTGAPTGGTYKLTVGAAGETAAIAFDANAAAVTAALEAIVAVGAGNVLCAGAITDGMTTTFQNSLGGTDIALMTLSDNSLTGGDNPTIGIVETVKGVAPVNEVQTITLINSATGGTFKLGYDGETTGSVAFDAAAATVEAALVALGGIGVDDVDCAGTLAGGMTATFASALAGTNVPPITLAENLLTGGTRPSIDIAESPKGVAPVNEIQTLTVEGGTPAGGTFALSFDGSEATEDLTYDAADSAVQAALEALSTIGEGNVACSGALVSGMTVTFQGTLAGANVPLLVLADNSLVDSDQTWPVKTVTDRWAKLRVEVKPKVDDSHGTLQMVYFGVTN